MSKELDMLFDIHANTSYIDKDGLPQHIFNPDDPRFQAIVKALKRNNAMKPKCYGKYYGKDIHFCPNCSFIGSGFMGSLRFSAFSIVKKRSSSS